MSTSDNTTGRIDIGGTVVKRLQAVEPEDIDPAAEVSYCRNVFVPLTTACRYTCTYCTYFDPPGQADLMSPTEIRETVRYGVDAGCTEALFTFGDDPDDRYTDIYDQLSTWGYDSIHEYLREACEIALEEGLLPHANPGDQTREQMELVADVNASIGVMLETTAEVQAHAGSRGKDPEKRLQTIQTAGELSIPFTTGILVGIGEDWADRAKSILEIRSLHERYGHIQEVIVQPVVENDRWRQTNPSIQTLRQVVAMARAGLPKDVSVQVPPNLASIRKLIDFGIDDLGGVSPVTVDHINHEYAWPKLCELEEFAENAGVELTERLPIHKQYVDEEWLPPKIRNSLYANNEAGRKFRSAVKN